MRKYLLIFAMLAIVLTACRIESNVNLDIEEDGSAVVLVEVGMDEEFREAMTGQTGSTEEDFIKVTNRVHRSPEQPSGIRVGVLPR